VQSRNNFGGKTLQVPTTTTTLQAAHQAIIAKVKKLKITQKKLESKNYFPNPSSYIHFACARIKKQRFF
jgi:hypothetical protein